MLFFLLQVNLLKKWPEEFEQNSGEGAGAQGEDAQAFKSLEHRSGSLVKDRVCQHKHQHHAADHAEHGPEEAVHDVVEQKTEEDRSEKYEDVFNDLAENGEYYRCACALAFSLHIYEICANQYKCRHEKHYCRFPYKQVGVKYESEYR